MLKTVTDGVLIADAFLRAKDYSQTAIHAEQMLAAAKTFATTTSRKCQNVTIC
jgi:hypothetical protein